MKNKTKTDSKQTSRKVKKTKYTHINNQKNKEKIK